MYAQSHLPVLATPPVWLVSFQIAGIARSRSPGHNPGQKTFQQSVKARRAERKPFCPLFCAGGSILNQALSTPKDLNLWKFIFFSLSVWNWQEWNFLNHFYPSSFFLWRFFSDCDGLKGRGLLLLGVPISAWQPPLASSPLSGAVSPVVDQFYSCALWHFAILSPLHTFWHKSHTMARVRSLSSVYG